jgi:RNA-directed DNA polymerase
MQKAIKNEIKRLADRAFARQGFKRKLEADYQARFHKRTGAAAGLPPAAGVNYLTRHFDPAYCRRHANFLAKTIWHKVQIGTYAPEPAVNFFIDKPHGGTRSLMEFAIPDTALANVMMRRLRERNIKRFSPHSFAYHPEKNVFDAILDLRSFILTSRKIYSVQIDFQNYFDCIPSGYLKKLLRNRETFSLTPAERDVIEAFIHHRYAQRVQYQAGQFERRHKGTPQGSSISLILANLANHSLDVALEKLPGKFVRFADDVTALCGSYEDAIKIEREFFHHCDATGIEMNRKKSPGIAVLADKSAEIRTVEHIDYLGYRFTETGLVLSDRTIARIKRKISRLVAIYLTAYIRNVGFNPNRVGHNPDFDWDMLGLISEIRNYLYGGLTEGEVGAMLRRGRKLRRMKGLMSF